MGLTLAKEYYQQFSSRIFDAAEALCPGLSGRISAGLAGEGSQCFGFDDEISRDHDFAPGFCIWLSDEDDAMFGTQLQSVYETLPKEFGGLTSQNMTVSDRLGVISVSEYFGRFTSALQSEEDWLLVPEANFAAAANGEIWKTGCRDFDEMRQRIQNFYPESVLRRKLAARAAVMSQSGQYNLLRMHDREDIVAKQLASARFTEAAVSMVHLLNRHYTPFYKWAYRSLTELAKESPLAEITATKLAKLPETCVLTGDAGRKKLYDITETICSAAAEELRRQGFSRCSSSFLQDHLAELSQGKDFSYGYL